LEQMAGGTWQVWEYIQEIDQWIGIVL